MKKHTLGNSTKYEPTEMQIKAACERIRSKWTRREFESRRAYREEPWSIPTWTLAGTTDKPLSDFTS